MASTICNACNGPLAGFGTMTWCNACDNKKEEVKNEYNPGNIQFKDAGLKFIGPYYIAVDTPTWREDGEDIVRLPANNFIYKNVAAAAQTATACKRASPNSRWDVYQVQISEKYVESAYFRKHTRMAAVNILGYPLYKMDFVVRGHHGHF